jgi:hypothetical protein
MVEVQAHVSSKENMMVIKVVFKETAISIFSAGIAAEQNCNVMMPERQWQIWHVSAS